MLLVVEKKKTYLKLFSVRSSFVTVRFSAIVSGSIVVRFLPRRESSAICRRKDLWGVVKKDDCGDDDDDVVVVLVLID